MDTALAYWLRWPSIEVFLDTYSWAWPLCEVVHFVGLILLVGAVGTYDLRLLGLGKGIPLSLLKRALPWGAAGFVLCVLTTNIWLQLKLLFIALAGVNVLAFYASGMGGVVDRLGPDDDVPPLGRFMGMASLALWLGVIYFGRLIPWEL